MISNALNTQMSFAKDQLYNHGQQNKTESLQDKLRSGDVIEAEKAAKEFEAMYLSKMFSHMFKHIKTDGYFGGGNQEEMFRSFMVDEYAKLTVESGGIGLSDSITREILSMQEKLSN